MIYLLIKLLKKLNELKIYKIINIIILIILYIYLSQYIVIYKYSFLILINIKYIFIIMIVLLCLELFFKKIKYLSIINIIICGKLIYQLIKNNLDQIEIFIWILKKKRTYNEKKNKINEYTNYFSLDITEIEKQEIIEKSINFKDIEKLIDIEYEYIIIKLFNKYIKDSMLFNNLNLKENIINLIFTNSFLLIIFILITLMASIFYIKNKKKEININNKIEIIEDKKIKINENIIKEDKINELNEEYNEIIIKGTKKAFNKLLEIEENNINKIKTYYDFIKDKPTFEFFNKMAKIMSGDQEFLDGILELYEKKIMTEKEMSKSSSSLMIKYLKEYLEIKNNK
jgi:hypothetical protein